MVGLVGARLRPVELRVLRRQPLLLAGPDPVRAPEVWKARVGADAGSREHYQPLGLGHPENQVFDSAIEVFHGSYPVQDTVRWASPQAAVTMRPGRGRRRFAEGGECA